MSRNYDITRYFNAESLEKAQKFVTETLEALIFKLPRWEVLLWKLIDAAFGPKQILFQLGLVAVLQIVAMGYESFLSATKILFSLLSSSRKRILELNRLMQKAQTYAEWEKHATEWDHLNGYDAWRKHDESSLLDHVVLKKRIQDVENLMRSGNVFDLMFKLRGGLSRDQFGLQHEGLFNKALAGTKHVVEKYHRVVSNALNYICDSVEDDIPTDAKLAFFNETRHAYGRSAIMLSGGAYLGYYHIGVAKTLWTERLLPRVISGASAGSLIASAIGTRTDDEFAEMYANYGDSYGPFRVDFFKFSTTIKSPTGATILEATPKILRPLIHPLLALIFDGKIVAVDCDHFVKVCQHNCGQYTFQEAFDRTGRIINITVAPVNNYDPPRLLNYLTAPHVCVWSAAVASCSIPGVFDSAELWVKEPDGNIRREYEWSTQGHVLDRSQSSHIQQQYLYTDGSLENDLPMQQLSELFNVNHFIVSQVNFHSALLSAITLRPAMRLTFIYAYFVGYIHFLKSQIKDWLKNFAVFLNSGAFTRSWMKGPVQVLTQSYEGREHDITIMPWVGQLSLHQASLSIIKNPTPEEYQHVVVCGEANTFPFMPRIRAHCSVEMTLDRCVQRLRQRISQEAAQELVADAEPAVGDSSQQQRRGMPIRQDSFFTSRSLINLSGLDVSDPTPLSMGNNNSSNAMAAAASSGDLAASNSSSSAGDNNDTSSNGYVLTGADLSCKSIPRSASSDLQQAGITKKGSNSDFNRSPLPKANTMANFYYKRSESNVALNALENPFA